MNSIIKQRHKIIPAVFLMLIQDGRILLQQRLNTGHEDGNYSLVGGHFEGKESATSVLIREAKEEIGITLKPTDLNLCYVLHKNIDEERIDLFFSAKKWMGTPKICEPEKCGDLQFFQLNALPKNTIEYIAKAIHDAQKNILYGEYGW